MVVAVALSLALACTPTSTPTSTARASASQSVSATEPPNPSPTPAIVLGGDYCVPPSPRIPNALGIIGTVVGTTSEGTQLFGLMHPLIQVGMEAKIVIRMTGRGTLETYAEHTDKTRIAPRMVEQHTLSSNFDMPGDEWGVFYTVPKAGCWRMHFDRESGSGDIWFIAVPPL
jgi:hypothetical protein